MLWICLKEFCEFRPLSLQLHVQSVPDSFNDKFWIKDVIKKSFPDFSEGVLRLLCGLVSVHANLKSEQVSTKLFFLLKKKIIPLFTVKIGHFINNV